MWTDDYIGIPYCVNGRDRDGIDCYGLIVLVYREQLSVTLPDQTDVVCGSSALDIRRARRAIAVGRDVWQRVDDCRPFDVVLLRSGAHIAHVGIVVNRRQMLHSIGGVATTIEDFTGPLWAHRVEEYRRYVS